ncbi:amino acid aminotransferase [Amaricoccus sp.]|uniref:amino acid aminotransferase n=1 Tax=Amaricoccus sp. TaxID=1872485 RepID=UPI001B621651|nr:amino acid aminotransferase [Amaricoccus sp.]MBP7240709.1 aspartate/tyrosine/aromatic aminotransferase [Amaricoccus sp.]
MLETLENQPADKIIALIAQFAADPRTDKVDLGVGVYKDAEGRTPVMRAVKAAERRLLDAQTTKSYVALLGDSAFNEAMADLVLGADRPRDRIAMSQQVGGTGAVRQLFDLARRANPDVTVWLPDPTWPNHAAILKGTGIPFRAHRYFDPATRGVDFDGMMADLRGMKAGDVLLLHGCCHNPTGANLTLAQWDALADLLAETGAIPMVDLAYQGFGDGLEEDAAGLRRLAARCPEFLLAASCSKNFGLYRDRVGLSLVIARNAAEADRARQNLSALNRLSFSFPPDHGAKVVEIILNDPELRADWKAELEGMRSGMLEMRQAFAEALRRATNSDRFDFITRHRGMFSLLGATPEQVQRIRDEHGIYMVGDSRINVAGLPAKGLDRLAAAIAASGF